MLCFTNVKAGIPALPIFSSFLGSEERSISAKTAQAFSVVSILACRAAPFSVQRMALGANFRGYPISSGNPCLKVLCKGGC
jgi:hypothetical protein